MNTVLFDIDLTDIPDFEDFAGSHYAYDENETLVWAPTGMKEFIEFMEFHYGYDSVAQSNFCEGAEEWKKYYKKH